MTDLAMPGSRAVLIGPSEYTSDKLLDAPAIVNTVHDLRTALIDRCGMAGGSIRTLDDPGEVREVESALARVARNTQGILLVYYAGHGLVGQDGELYLAVRETDLASGRREFTAVSYDRVRRVLANSPARTVIVILDCCYSALARTLPVPSGTESGLVLTSAGPEEQAIAREGERYTAFTGELLNLLNHGDPDGPEHLTLWDACLYLQNTLQARNLPRPLWSFDGNAPQIVLAANPAYRPGAADEPTVSRSGIPATPDPPPVNPPQVPTGPDPAPTVLDPVPAGPDPAPTVLDPVPAGPDPAPTVLDPPPAPDPTPPAPDPAPDPASPKPDPAPDPGSAANGSRSGSGGATSTPDWVEGSRRFVRNHPVGAAASAVAVVVVVVALIVALTLLASPGGSTHALTSPTTPPASSGGHPTTNPTHTPCAGGTLAIVGSTAFAPIAQLVANAYQDACPQAHIVINAQDSASGYSMLVQTAEQNPGKPIPIIDMFDGTYTSSSDPVKEQPVGLITFAIVANSIGSHQSSISVSGLESIFLPPGQKGVLAVGRLGGSGSRKALLNNVFNKPLDSSPVGPTCPGTPGSVTCSEDYTWQVLDFVNRTSNAIGYAGYTEFTNNRAEYPNVYVVNIGGAAPTAQAAENGSYKFWTVEHLYTASLPSELVSDFLAYLSNYLAKNSQDGFIACAHVPASLHTDCPAS